MFDAFKEIITGKEVKEEHKTKKDIEGWLALFVFGLYTAIPIILFYILEFEIMILKILYLIYFIFLIYIIVLMHKRKKIFSKLAIAFMWFWFVIILVEIIYFKMILSPVIFSEWIRMVFNWGILIKVVVAILWSRYLLKSKRVKNTFTKN